VSQKAPSGTYFYLGDGLGSTIKTVDASGNPVNAYTYDVYGKTKTATGPQSNDFQFAGEQGDASTGLQYLRARYYDTATGRFMSRDPLASRPGWAGHPFAYAGGNPVNATDPSGLYCEDAADKSLCDDKNGALWTQATGWYNPATGARWIDDTAGWVEGASFSPGPAPSQPSESRLQDVSDKLNATSWFMTGISLTLYSYAMLAPPGPARIGAAGAAAVSANIADIAGVAAAGASCFSDFRSRDCAVGIGASFLTIALNTGPGMFLPDYQLNRVGTKAAITALGAAGNATITVLGSAELPWR
jgi:RHS repeat-associated protein